MDLLWSPLLYLKLVQVDVCGFQCLDAIAAYLDVAMPLLYKVRVVPDVQQVFQAHSRRAVHCQVPFGSYS